MLSCKKGLFPLLGNRPFLHEKAVFYTSESFSLKNFTSPGENAISRYSTG